MDECSAEKNNTTTGLQCAEIIYRVYIYIIAFKGLKFYKVDSLDWPGTNKQHELLKC